MGLALLAWASHASLQPVSRRACNATYVLWVMAICWGGLGLFACLDLLAAWKDHQEDADSGKPQLHPRPQQIQSAKRPPSIRFHLRILEAFNQQGLLLFLLANVLTGALNMTCDLGSWGALQGQTMVVLYLGSLSSVGVLLV